MCREKLNMLYAECGHVATETEETQCRYSYGCGNLPDNFREKPHLCPECWFRYLRGEPVSNAPARWTVEIEFRRRKLDVQQDLTSLDEINRQSQRYFSLLPSQSFTLPLARKLVDTYLTLVKELNGRMPDDAYNSRKRELEKALIRIPVPLRLQHEYTAEDVFIHAEILETLYSEDCYSRYVTSRPSRRTSLINKMDRLRDILMQDVELLVAKFGMRTIGVAAIEADPNFKRLWTLYTRVFNTAMVWQGIPDTFRQSVLENLLVPVADEDIPKLEVPERDVCIICSQKYGTTDEDDDQEPAAVNDLEHEPSDAPGDRGDSAEEQFTVSEDPDSGEESSDDNEIDDSEEDTDEEEAYDYNYREDPSQELVGEYPVKLPCNHIFGDECITKWLSSKGRCPVCRQEYPEIPLDGSDEFAE